KLEVHGATPLRDSELAAAVLLVDAPLTAELIDAMPARIKDLYAKNGFLHARASVSRRLITPKHARLLARIDPGQQVAVSRVRFPNAVQFSNDFLREQLASYLDEDLPGGGLIAPVDSEVAAEITHGQAPTHARQVPRPQEQSPEHTYYEPTYEQAIKHITELYQAAGYLAVQVGPPVLRELDKLHAAVEIPVVEGPRTVVHSLVLHGQERVSAQELLITAGILRGAPFSYLLLEEARVRLQELYQERGHVFVRIEPSVRFSSDRTRAEVSVQIVEGFAVNVGEIVVRGAERTSVDFIRSLLALKPGDVFRPSLAHTSERTLSMLGVMQGISVQLEDPDLPARVKRLIVNVSERSNQFLDFSAGLSTGQGARAGFDYGYRNLFGHAVGLTLRVQFAYQLLFVRPQLAERFDRLLFSDRLERNVALGLVIPRTPGLGATRANLDLVHVRDNERDFGLDKNGITLGFTENPWQRVTLLEAADLENNNIDVFESGSLQDLIERTVDPRVQRLLRVPEGNTTLVALRMSLSYDQRDSPFVPTTGYFVSLASELASTLRVEDSQFLSRFLKLQVTGSGYIPVGRSIVIAGQVRVGRIVHLAESSETYPNRAFFLGGVETMRGYYQDELIPQDLADAAFQDHNEVETRRSIVRSGDAFVLLRGEVRFPIYGQLGGGLFADFGNLWKNAASMNPLDLRPTAGAGLRLSTPVGPIAVDYGIVLVRRVGLAEPFGTLHFSIGLF
ncbi:MAG: BamA/TamA family outer membrane protein, partial [Polyangiales bacterium]